MNFLDANRKKNEELTQEDHARLAILANFKDRAGFAAMQSTRPQSVAYALTDSPVGQLPWNELLMGFGDYDTLDRDQILTHVSLYWFTRTAGSSARQYYEDAHAQTQQRPNTTPTGVAVFHNDFRSIRPFAARDNTQIVHWTEFDRGGHFAAMEVPELLAGDLRTFFRLFR